MNVKQALATSIALIERLRTEQEARINQLQETVSVLESKPVPVPEQKVVQLPTTLVYESQLHELAAELTNYVNLEARHLTNRLQSLGETVELKDGATKELLNSRISSLTENLSTGLASTLKSLGESESALRGEIETLARSQETFRDEAFSRVQESDLKTIKLYNKVTNDLATEAEKRVEELAELQDAVYSALRNVEISITEDAKNKNALLLDDIKNLRVSLEDQVKDLQTQVDVLKNSTQENETRIEELALELLSRIGEVKDFSSEELLPIASKVENLESNLETLADKLKKISLNKPKDGKDGKDGSDGTNGKDGSDGKDAHEWEFKPHPTMKGFLMFKREDQTEWKKIDLRVHMPQPQSNFMAGGPLVAPPQNENFGGITVLEEGSQVSEEVVSINFTGNLVDVEDNGSGSVTVTINSNSSDVQFIKREIFLSGVSQVITFSDLGIQDYYSYKVVNSSGDEVSIAIREQASTFTLSSNVDMSGLSFVIRGF